MKKLPSDLKLPRAVLFDNDGVLIQSEPLHGQAWQRLCKDIGVELKEEFLKKSVGRTSPQILKDILDVQKPGWTAAQFDLDALSLKKNDYYGAIARSQLKPYPFVKEGLQWLRSKQIKMGVVSNGKRRELELGLEITDLKGFMDAIVSRDDTPHPKPHPLPYVTGAALLGCEPQDCFSIEDSPSGLSAALLAGTIAFAVSSNFSEAALLTPLADRSDLSPVHVFESMQSFFEALKKI